jgi:hypothetical protein
MQNGSYNTYTSTLALSHSSRSFSLVGCHICTSKYLTIKGQMTLSRTKNKECTGVPDKEVIHVGRSLLEASVDGRGGGVGRGGFDVDGVDVGHSRGGGGGGSGGRGAAGGGPGRGAPASRGGGGSGCAAAAADRCGGGGPAATVPAPPPSLPSSESSSSSLTWPDGRR